MLPSRSRPAFSLTSLLAAAVLVAPAVGAATVTWTGTTGDWATTTNWSDGLEPAAGNAYTVDGAGSNVSAPVADTVAFGGDALTVSNGATLTLANINRGSTVTIPSLTLSDATLTLSSTTSSMDSVTRTLVNQVAFANTVTIESGNSGSFTNTLVFSNGFSGSGNLVIRRGSTTGTGRVVNVNGTNSTAAYSGAVSTSGQDATHTVALNLNTASGWGTGTLSIGDFSAVNVASGVSASSGAITVGTAGTLQFGGGTSFTAANAIANGGAIVRSGSNTVTLTGEITGAGALTVTSGTLILDRSSVNYTGAVNVRGGTLRLGNSITSGTITLGATSVAVDTGATLSLGANASNVNITYNFASLTGAIAVSGGTLNFNKSTGSTQTLGAALNFTGDSKITGTSSSYSQILVMNGAIDGSGTLGIDFLNSATTRTLSLNGDNSTYSGLVTLGAINVGGSGASNNGSTATLNLNKTLGTAGWAITNANWTVNLGNRTHTFASLNSTVNPLITASGAATVLNVGSGNGTDAYAGRLGGTLALTKEGSGALALNGTNTYTGATVVSAGQLLINGSTGATAATVNGGVFGGSGSHGGTVRVNTGATLRGGTGASASGALTVSGAITLAAGSVVQLALGAGGLASQIHADGGIAFDANQHFSFLDLGAETGTYASLITGVIADPGSASGWTIANAGWSGVFSYNAGTQSIDLVLTAVPEPSAYGLLGAGALAAVTLVRRRRRS